jgi:phage protein U
MMLALDQFVFSMDTLPWQELQRQTQWKHRGNSRIGARDSRQYLGPGDDQVTITGVLVPQITGSTQSIEDLRAMADAGEAYVLVDATGLVYGAFVIEAVSETQAGHDKDGAARRIDFSVGLTRVDDGQVAEQLEASYAAADA